MRLQAITTPDPGHCHVSGSQPPCQASGAPVRAAVVGTALGPLQNPGFQLGGAFGYRAPLMPGDQASQPLCSKASGPPLHIRRTARQIRRRSPQTTSAGQFQNDPRPSGILRAHAPRTHAALHFPAFWWSKNQSFGGHESSLSVAWPLSRLHCTRSVALVGWTLAGGKLVTTGAERTASARVSLLLTAMP